MIFRLVAILSAALALTLTRAQAAGDTGASLQEACTIDPQENPIKTGYCLGYLNGIWEGLRLGVQTPFILEGKSTEAQLEKIANTLLEICLPQDVNRKKVLTVVLAYIEETAESLEQSARTVVKAALSKAYPCP